MSKSNPIPMDKAFELCKKHRDKRKVRIFSQCGGCLIFKRRPKQNVLLQPSRKPWVQINKKTLR